MYLKLLLLPFWMITLAAAAQDVYKTIVIKRVDQQGKVTEERIVSNSRNDDSLPATMTKVTVSLDSLHPGLTEIVEETISERIFSKKLAGNGQAEVKVIVMNDGKEKRISLNGKELPAEAIKNIRIEKKMFGDSALMNIDSIITLDVSEDNSSFRLQGRNQRGQVFQITKEDQISTAHNNKATLGIMIEDTDEGVLVTEILPGSAAEKAGIRRGDVVLKVNQTYIFTGNTLLKALHPYNPGEKVKVRCLRNGKEVSIKAVLQKRD